MVSEQSKLNPDSTPQSADGPAGPTAEPASATPWLRLGETPRQAGMLFSAQTASTLAGLLATLILARWMEPAALGRFQFCLTVVVLSSLLFELGIFSAGARVLALAADESSERRALGALILMAVALNAAFAVFIALAAFPLDLIFRAEVKWVLIGAAAFAFLQPFQLLVEQSCQGLNRIRSLSWFQVRTAVLYVSLLAGLAAGRKLTAFGALIAYLAAIGLSSAWTLARLRPSFAGSARYVRLTVAEARKYGLNIYLARLTGAASTRLDSLVITFFLGRASAGLAPLGLYAIAQKLSNPIATMSRVIAITRFRAFAKLDEVPSRIRRWNTLLLIASSAALAVIGPSVLKLVFPRYGEAARLLVPFAVFNLFAGLFQPYNAFLTSHGRGAELRNIAAGVTLASLAGMIAAVPRFGIDGAAWAAAAAMALDYALHVYYYRRFRRTLG